MKFYTLGNMSSNCRSVSATAAHLNIDLDVQQLNPMEGQLSSNEFRAVNPNQMAPALEDGGFKLWESRAISQFLCDKTPGQTLWPKEAQQRADVGRWMYWNACHLGRATGTMAYEKIMKPQFMKMDPDKSQVEWAQKQFDKHAPVLNAQLESTPWIAGTEMTLADFDIGAHLQWAEASGLSLKDYTYIQKWQENLNKTEAWSKTTPEMSM